MEVVDFLRSWEVLHWVGISKAAPEGVKSDSSGSIAICQAKLLPKMDKDAISDRIKADDLVKGLVCFQTAWIIVRVIARKAPGLSVTLLKLNTVATSNNRRLVTSSL